MMLNLNLTPLSGLMFFFLCINKISIFQEEIKKKKGILKLPKTWAQVNKHVDFDTDIKFIPFNEEKDRTIEIQIVKEIKQVVSYKALFQAKKDEEKKKKEEEESQEKKRLAEEKKKNKKVREKVEAVDKSHTGEKHPSKETKEEPIPNVRSEGSTNEDHDRGLSSVEENNNELIINLEPNPTSPTVQSKPDENILTNEQVPGVEKCDKESTCSSEPNPNQEMYSIRRNSTDPNFPNSQALTKLSGTPNSMLIST